MIDSAEPQPANRFSAEHDDLVEYREISRMAVGGLVLGIFSVLAIFTSVLWIVPIVAIIFCLIAYYQVSNSATLTGKTMAMIGMALAAIWLGASVTQVTVQNNTFKAGSREMAQQWLELLMDGKLMEAHQLTQQPGARAPLKVPLAAFYSEEDMREEGFKSFSSRDIIGEMQKHKGKLEAKFLRDVTASINEGVRYGTHQFVVSDKETGKPLWNVNVAMERHTGTGDWEGKFVWVAQGVSLDKTYH